jgi:polyhydroxyalkanoate synthesis regulator phasin
MAKNPLNRDALKKLLDTVTPMNPDTAERFVRELMRIGDERRRDAERLMSEVTAAGRKSAEHFSASVQKEVAKQLGRVVQRIDSLERQIENLNRNVEVTRTAVAAAAGKAMARSVPGSGESAKSEKKKPGVKSAAKKSAAKKSAAKKPAAKGAKSSSKKKSTTQTSGKKSASAKKKKANGSTDVASGSSTSS